MKIIPQSFKHLPESDDHVMQIGSRARICYQSEPKDDETGFVQGIIKKGHNSCLEMSVIHLILTPKTPAELHALLDSNYIIVDQKHIMNNDYYCSGSIRAWREFIIKHYPDPKITNLAINLNSFLSSTDNSIFWMDLCASRKFENDYYISHFDPIHQTSAIQSRHEHVAMQIITNRAVTHEIVRHRPVAYLQESQRYVRYDKPGGIEFIAPDAFFEEESLVWEIWEEHMLECESCYKELLKTCSPQAARLVLPNSCKTEIIVYCSLNQWQHILSMRYHPTADPSMQNVMEPMFNWFKEHYPRQFTDQKSLKRSIG